MCVHGCAHVRACAYRHVFVHVRLYLWFMFVVCVFVCGVSALMLGCVCVRVLLLFLGHKRCVYVHGFSTVLIYTLGTAEVCAAERLKFCRRL